MFILKSICKSEKTIYIEVALINLFTMSNSVDSHAIIGVAQSSLYNSDGKKY